MLYQHDIVAGQQIANPFPVNQGGRLQYDFGFSSQAKGVCSLYENGCSHIITPCINEKNKRVFE